MTRKKLIYWITPFGDDVASNRLRLNVARLSKHFIFHSGMTPSVGTDILIVGKARYDFQDSLLQAVGQLKQKGSKIVIDYTDHFLAPYIPCAYASKQQDSLFREYYDRQRELYNRLIPLADAIFVSSSGLSRALEEFSEGKTIHLIRDAIDPIGSATERASIENSFLWYGSDINFQFLLDEIVDLQHRLTKPYVCNVLCSPTLASQLKSARWRLPKFTSNIKKLNIRNWSLSSMFEFAASSDFILIPGNKNNPIKSLVSDNRLITAFSSKKPVFATPLESYKEHSDCYLTLRSEEVDEYFAGAPFKEAILEEALSRSLNYSPSRLVKEWEKIILLLISQR